MSSEKFLKDGYILLPGALDSATLLKWQKIADTLESQALESYKKGESIKGACVVEDPTGPRLMRYDELYLEYHEALIELLAIEPMVKIMKELSGPGSMVIYSDLLFKHQHPHPVIKWHQGAPHSRNYPYLNIGIYLDDADLDDGCLRYVPGTQSELQAISDLEEQYGWNPPGVVQQPAKAGDILVQDMMILHSSEPKRSPGARRTIYVEIRPYQAIIEEGQASTDWLNTRKAFMQKVWSVAKDEEFVQNKPGLFTIENTPIADLAGEMAHYHMAPIPAAYSIRDVKGPNYPIPADLV